MNSPVIESRRRAAYKVALAAAKKAFKDALPADTEEDILDGLAKDLPLARFSLLCIIRVRPHKKLLQFEQTIYEISDRFLMPATQEMKDNMTEIVNEGKNNIPKEENNDCGNMSDDSMESVSLLAMYKEENRDKDNKDNNNGSKPKEDNIYSGNMSDDSGDSVSLLAMYKEENRGKEENRDNNNRDRDNNNDNKRSVGALEAVRTFRKTNKASFIDI